MNLPFLIVAYNKFESFCEIYNKIRTSGSAIYVHLDFDPKEDPDHQKLREFCKKEERLGNIYLKMTQLNLGSCYGPISAFDWFYEQVQVGIVLEEDCIPNSKLINTSLMPEENEIICLNSYLIANPSDKVLLEWSDTVLFNSWGWITTKKTYDKIRPQLKLDGQYNISDQFPRFLRNYFTYLAKINEMKKRPTWWDFQFMTVSTDLNIKITKPTYSLIEYKGHVQNASHTWTPDRLLKLRYFYLKIFLFITRADSDRNFAADLCVWLKFGPVKWALFQYSDMPTLRWIHKWKS